MKDDDDNDDDDDDNVNAWSNNGFGTNSVTMLPVVVRSLLCLYRRMAIGWMAKVHLQELNWSSSINSAGVVSVLIFCVDLQYLHFIYPYKNQLHWAQFTRIHNFNRYWKHSQCPKRCVESKKDNLCLLYMSIEVGWPFCL